MVDLGNLGGVSEQVQGLQGRASKFIHDFRGFFLKQNVFALAIAVIIGTATNNVVQAMIKDLFMPVVNLVIKDQAWVTWGPTIGTIDVADLDAAGNPQFVDAAGKIIPSDPLGLPSRPGGHLKTKQMPNKLLLGDLVWQVTNLLVIGLITYMMTRHLLRPPPPGPPTRVCPHCLERVVLEAKVCRYCTRDLPAPSSPSPAPAN